MVVPQKKGTPAGQTVATGANDAGTTANKTAFQVELLVFLVVAGLIVWLGGSTDMLRDAEPTDFGGAKPPGSNAKYRRPYSLAQTQMAWWFGIILASFVYLKLVGIDTNAILTTPQPLILMGIGIGTALGAAVIEQTKSKTDQTPSDQLSTLDEFKSVLKQLDDLPPGSPVPASLTAQRDKLAKALASESFFRDILTDVDGVCLHRFQALAWTVVIGVFFLFGVVAQNALPNLGDYLLAVLGISGGTYLGFKDSGTACIIRRTRLSDIVVRRSDRAPPPHFPSLLARRC